MTAAASTANRLVLAGEPAKSALFVPLVAGGKRPASISLQNLDREHAFSESDVQLLCTLAGSLSVALENARLVHETRQRNAELAVINSVQESIAGELDPQAIYDLVGEKLREVFDAQVVDIAIHDADAGLMRFVYQIERGVPLPERDHAGDGLPQARASRHASRSLIDEDMPARSPSYGNPRPSPASPPTVGDLPAARRRRTGRRAPSPSRTSTASTRSARRTSSCSRRSPAASGSRSRTPARSTRRGSGSPSSAP